MFAFSRLRSPLLGLLAAAGLMGAARAETSWTPLTFRQVSGTRPFVPVKLNGEPFLFMVHANAGFFAMTDHANAAKAGVGALVHYDAFGIEAPGQVSKLGRDKAVVKALQVGGDVTMDAPLFVFEVPKDVEMNGMLGLGWLRAKRAMVDYGTGRLGIPSDAGDSDKLRARLLSQGYVAHAMAWDAAQNRYWLAATINGVEAKFVVSTVSHLAIDSGLALQAGIALSPPVDKYAGPSGTTGYQYQNASPISMSLGGQTVTVPTLDIHDIYAYDGEKRPAAAELVGGYLGCEFLLPNKGVIDFGAGVLYLKP